MDNPTQNLTPSYIVQQASPEVEAAATTSLWLEIIFGIFSLLGVGHIYSGRIWLGLGLMLGWWLYIAVAAVLSIITLGFGTCIFVPIYIAVPILSGIQARTYVQRTGGKGNWTHVAIAAGAGCLVLIFVIVILIALGIFAAVSTQYYQR